MNREMAEIIRNQTPICMPPSATVQDACKQMDAHRIGAVLVIDTDHHLVGIFTGRDCVRVMAHGEDGARAKLRDVMTHRPQSMPPESKAIEALRLMRDGGFRHVPVVEDGKVIGIVSRGDFRGLEQDRLDVEVALWEGMR
jgi:CBS domain-containing protein